MGLTILFAPYGGKKKSVAILFIYDIFIRRKGESKYELYSITR